MSDIADRYDRILSSTPINKQAATTLFSKGAQGLTEPVYSMAHSDVPLPTQPVPAGLVDRTGQRKGKLTVYGYYYTHPKKGRQWVVRCVCGRYEIRYSKALDNEANDNDCCHLCRKLIAVKRSANRQAYFDRNGRWPEEGSK